jgi:hypothetical protein
MSAYIPFDFSDEFLERLRELKEIPVHFYNREGQILIFKKKDVTDLEIDRLVRFRRQGIYYDNRDEETIEDLFGETDETREIPEGLTDTKLISEKYTDILTRETEGILESIRKLSVQSKQMEGATKQIEEFFTAFAGQEDAMTGLVNILEVMRSRNTVFDVELSVKRTVVAMALKTRGMHAAAKFKEGQQIKKNITSLMLSSLLCDIGYYKMNIPKNAEISSEQMQYIRKHPFLSYLMVAHEPALDAQVKHGILTHHRPRPDDRNDNNYPVLKPLMNRLEELHSSFSKQTGKKHIARDIQYQLGLFRENRPYRENANVLAVSSEFASLTSDVPWRKALSAEEAVKAIINNSYFTYTDRIIHEFLDYVAISLCDNHKILKEGDFIVIAAGQHGGNEIFEACQIETIGRFQSRPGVRRIATVAPIFTREPRFGIKGFEIKSLKLDPRKAHFELTVDGSRRIVFYVDPVRHSDFYKVLSGAVQRYFSAERAINGNRS